MVSALKSQRNTSDMKINKVRKYESRRLAGEVRVTYVLIWQNLAKY